MNTDYQPRCTSQQLAEQIASHIQELAQATDAARFSTEMLRYLETYSRFHHYSLHNLWLILMACPEATQVAGFQAWRSLNRFVRKGEHGIAILAPIIVKEETKDKDPKPFLRGFKVVFVFDASQTEGEPLPAPPDWKSPEKNALLTERLLAFAKEQGITVTEKVLAGEIQGVSTGGAIELAPTAGTSTLIHEIAHELMHHKPDASADRSIRELEAESVAYVVSRHFGLESEGSPNYVVLHGATSEMIIEHLERIRNVVMEIVQFLEPQSCKS
jgi:hypothetical protein